MATGDAHSECQYTASWAQFDLRQFQSELEGSPDRRRMTFRMASSKSMLESHFLVEAEKKRK